MKVKLLSEGAYMPERAHRDDAGADLRTPVKFVLGAHESAVVDFGLAVEIPPGYYGELMSKSGLNVKHNIQSMGGVIDSGYTGTIKGRVTNNGDYDHVFYRGDKVMQLVIKPCLCCGFSEASEFDYETERGDAGYGSTGSR